MLFAVFFDIGQHGVRPDGVAFFRKVQVVPADAGEQFAGGVQKAPVDVGVSGAGQLALGQNVLMWRKRLKLIFRMPRLPSTMNTSAASRKSDRHLHDRL